MQERISDSSTVLCKKEGTTDLMCFTGKGSKRWMECIPKLSFKFPVFPVQINDLAR